MGPRANLCIEYSIVLVTRSCLTLRSHGLSPIRLLCPWNFQARTRVGCLFLLQGIFPTQGSNLSLLHCRQILYHLSHQGSPRHVHGDAQSSASLDTGARSNLRDKDGTEVEKELCCFPRQREIQRAYALITMSPLGKILRSFLVKEDGISS